MNAQDTIASPAEVYDKHFVPALFEHWAPVVAGAAAITPGDRVLDVACGTGVLALAAAEIAGGKGEVIGLDINPEMLAVARRKHGQVSWREGDAQFLPFEDGCFDAVVSQFGFMFFEDKPGALREMVRVLKPNGRLAVAVCASLSSSAGYSALTGLLERLFGSDIAEAFRRPFVLGERDVLAGLCAEAGLQKTEIVQKDGAVTFDSIAALVSTERACAWTLGGLLDDAQFDELLRAAESALAPFADSAGRVRFQMPAMLITYEKEG